ncbi:unnamed protein product [Mycena citricolor]|uniref:Uncharacterized protein n=1 Tax=Mycena citricolor TaxID=2018698 RepID=A0AAD2HGX6_9AGAR|nr:unnamed protein product [Mycena citricolor]
MSNWQQLKSYGWHAMLLPRAVSELISHSCALVIQRDLVYSNSLLASLNSRVALHSASQKIQNAEFGSMPTSTFQAVHFKSVPAVGSAVTTASGIGDLDERQRT